MKQKSVRLESGHKIKVPNCTEAFLEVLMECLQVRDLKKIININNKPRFKIRILIAFTIRNIFEKIKNMLKNNIISEMNNVFDWLLDDTHQASKCNFNKQYILSYFL